MSDYFICTKHYIFHTRWLIFTFSRFFEGEQALLHCRGPSRGRNWQQKDYARSPIQYSESVANTTDDSAVASLAVQWEARCTGRRLFYSGTGCGTRGLNCEHT